MDLKNLKRLIDDKWLHWTYDAIRVELLSLAILTFIHGKNLWYLTDIYPVALFLFMLPLGVTAFFEYVLGFGRHSNYILLGMNIICILFIGNYIITNYYVHPAAYRTGGHGLLGDSTVYAGKPQPVFKPDIETPAEKKSALQEAGNAVLDSVKGRFGYMAQFKVQGVSLLTPNPAYSNSDTFLAYVFYWGIPDNNFNTLYQSRWRVSRSFHVVFRDNKPLHPSDSITDKELARALREAF